MNIDHIVNINVVNDSVRSVIHFVDSNDVPYEYCSTFDNDEKAYEFIEKIFEFVEED